ncbi:MAG TPA: allantoinase AllB [Bryobacteraceae bacterium]|nr:allantoinase AllB [Bryobacteraceae bacterium]
MRQSENKGSSLQTIRSNRVVTAEGVAPKWVTFDEGRIVSAGDSPPSSLGDVLDIGDNALLPGLVDPHVHINEPGRTEWEGFATGTRAAAAGGITCLVDMPLNSIPSTTNEAALEQKRYSANGQCVVDYAFWGGVVPGNAGELRGLARAGVRGFKCFLSPTGTAEFTAVSFDQLRSAMPSIVETGLPLLVHAESPDCLLEADPQADPRVYATYLNTRPSEAEVKAIGFLIDLCREYRHPVHVVHLSAAEAVPDLQHAREEGLPITVETCPHYLSFVAEQIPAGATEYKCAPPIRNAANQKLLWEALRDGTVDMVVTDHSPCPPGLKCREQGNFLTAWGGIASLSLSLAATWTAARQQGFSLSDVVRWMCEKPAALAGLSGSKGTIEPGCDADFVVFDPDAEFVVTEDRLHFRHPVSPYLGLSLKGAVKMTFLRGKMVFERNTATGGRECRRVQ